MKANELKAGSKVKANKTIKKIPLSPGLEIPKGEALTVLKVIDGKAFVRYEGREVQVDPADLNRA